MTKDDAVFWLKQIKERYIRDGDEEFDRCRKEAIDMAVEVLPKQTIEWHPYPQEKPSDERELLVTYIETSYYGARREIRIACYDGTWYEPQECLRVDDVTAWAELPKPYEEGDDNADSD